MLKMVFLVLVSLFSAALFVNGHGGRLMVTPTELHQLGLQALAERLGGGDMDRAVRALGTSHSSYSTICDSWGDSGVTSPTLDITVGTSDDDLLDCMCNCDGWGLEISSDTTSNLFCPYQSFSEAILECYGSDALEDCEDACDSGNGEALWSYYDCLWASFHSAYTTLGMCTNATYASSVDDSSECTYYDDDGVGWTQGSEYASFTEACEDLNGAAPSAGRKLIAAMVVANGLLVVAALLATTLL